MQKPITPTASARPMSQSTPRLEVGEPGGRSSAMASFWASSGSVACLPW